ncbi:Cell division and transport-associated protein TolA [Faunimonas pinastri]|uniref:Cell division and transport-associated protein TolA n=1 Tax=Faunimonas pinastri TaxID=1855383 RepID=A0A1H8Z7T4_9HYPH|nr:hypothetical protein [Faunimonas pinastri]SEP60317.1 Cell division and transport-associated protein TolA [Faunimonas pinastri]
MRLGAGVSIAVHLGILVFALFGLPNSKPMNVDDFDAMPVDLVDMSEISDMRIGDKKAKPVKDEPPQTKSNIKAPTPSKPADKPVDRPVDAANEAAPPPTQAPTPEPPKPTPTPPPPPPPPPPPEPAPKPPEPAPPPPKPVPPPVEKPAPPPPKPAPEPTPEPAPKPEQKEEAKPQPEKPTPPAPKPPPPRPTPPKPTPPKPTPPKMDKADQDELTKLAEATPKQQSKEKSQDSKSNKKFDEDNIAALLNKQKAGGGDPDPANKPQTFGSDKGKQTASLSQSEVDALKSALYRCWNPPVAVREAGNLQVEIRIELQQNGQLAAAPQLLSGGGDPVGQVAAESAMRAVEACAPYTMLPADKFESWHQIDFTFDPSQMLGG